ncbi:MAG: hypothetical protein PVG40_01430, partial [Desulfobacterales bacterium]
LGPLYFERSKLLCSSVRAKNITATIFLKTKSCQISDATINMASISLFGFVSYKEFLLLNR